MRVTDCVDYRKLLEEKIKENSSVRGYQTKLAEAAGCQKAFISQILKGTANLSLDHGISLAQFWGFSETDTEYFLNLIQMERAGTQILRQYFSRQLKRLKVDDENIAHRFGWPRLDQKQDEALYY